MTGDNGMARTGFENLRVYQLEITQNQEINQRTTVNGNYIKP